MSDDSAELVQPPDDAFEVLGNEPTATFGVVTHEGIDTVSEIVGPLKPRAVYYGHIWTETGVKPLVFLNFNKYRSDLPPWRDVNEFVLAAEDDGRAAEFAFRGLVTQQGIDITGDLKTVSLACEYVWNGIEQCSVVDRREVAEKRGLTNVQSGTEFKVTEDLT
jgi:hypothetical protein